MAKYTVGILILISSIVIDWKILKEKFTLKMRIYYGVVAGAGFLLITIYGSIFTVQSPILILVKWLRPVTKWVST